MKLKDLIKGIFATNDIRVIMFDEENESDSGNNRIYEGMANEIPEKILEEGVLNKKDFLVNDEDNGVMKIFIDPNQEIEFGFKHKDDPKEEPKIYTEEEIKQSQEEQENKYNEAVQTQSTLDQILTQLKLMNKMFFSKNYKSYTGVEEKEWDKLAEEFEKEVNK